MSLTKEQQENLLHEAARKSDVGGHVQSMGCTAAERVMQMFGGKQNTPRTMSYLYCDSVDACFYYQNDKACCVFTAKWLVGTKDLARLDEAGKLISTMLNNMQDVADEALREEQTDER